MQDNEKILELVNLISNLVPNFKKNIGKNQISNAGKSVTHLSFNQEVVFRFICQEKKVSMSQLCNALGISNQQMTRIINDLVHLDLVKREVDSENRRRVYALPTLKGCHCFEEILMQMHKKAVELFSSFDEKDIDDLIVHLTAVSNIFSKRKDNE